ncbi:uncharacterized protein [Palaemon carinicauda]|uniref:uncharacterized protein isoform X2 n=1 Tax=Palaemon carinicauda TaxID=392227 RepID=UPI0035B5E768
MDPQDLYRLESYCVGSPQETRRKSAPDIKSTAIECITCAVGSRRDIEEDVLSVPVSLLKELDDLHTKLADEIFTWKMHIRVIHILKKKSNREDGGAF